MKKAIFTTGTIISLFGLLMLNGCNVIIGISGADLRATQAAMVWPTVTYKASQTAQVDVENRVAATLTARPTLDIAATVEATCKATQPAPEIVALVTHHDKYVTATGEDGDWLLRQVDREEGSLTPCEWFVLHHLDDGEVALMTCHEKYVTAPVAGVILLDWALRQEPELHECGRFTLQNLGAGQVAFKTCFEERFFTSLDDVDRPVAEQWLIIGLSDHLDAWEMFTIRKFGVSH